MPVPHERQQVIARRLQKDEVHDRLLAAILSGDLPAGARLRDVDLEVWLGVSRTPIRSALVRLEQIGLVEASPQRWTRVARLRPSVVPELVVALCGLWRELPHAGRGLLAPGASHDARRALERCAAVVAAFRESPSPRACDSRAVVDAAFACVAQLEGAELPEITGQLLRDLGARLHHQAAVLGRCLDVGPLAACLAEVDAAVVAGDPRLLRSAIDGLARRTATEHPALEVPRPSWWRR